MVEQESSGGVPGGTGGGWGAEPSGSGDGGGGSTSPKEEPPKPNQWGELPGGGTGTGAPGAIDRPGEAAEKLKRIGGGASTSQIEQRYAREDAIRRGEGISERFQPFAEKLLQSETAQFAPGARQRLYEKVWLRNPDIQPATIYRPYGAEKKQDPYVTPPKDTLTLPKSSLESTEPNENLHAFDIRQRGIKEKYEGAGRVVDAWAKEDPYRQFAGERLKNFMGLGELGETAFNVGRFGIREPRMLKESVPSFEQTTQGTKDVLVAGFVTPIKEKGIVGAAGIAADFALLYGVSKGIGKAGSVFKADIKAGGIGKRAAEVKSVRAYNEAVTGKGGGYLEPISDINFHNQLVREATFKQQGLKESVVSRFAKGREQGYIERAGTIQSHNIAVSEQPIAFKKMGVLESLKTGIRNRPTFQGIEPREARTISDANLLSSELKFKTLGLKESYVEHNRLTGETKIPDKVYVNKNVMDILLVGSPRLVKPVRTLPSSTISRRAGIRLTSRRGLKTFEGDRSGYASGFMGGLKGTEIQSDKIISGLHQELRSNQNQNQFEAIVQREKLTQGQRQFEGQMNFQGVRDIQTVAQVQKQVHEQVQQQTQKQKLTNPFRELQQPRRKPTREPPKIRPSFEGGAKPKSSKRAKKETIFGFREYTNPIHDLEGFEKPIKKTKKKSKGFKF